MEKNEIISILKKLRETSTQRKFKQTFDLVVNLKGLDLKKQEQQVDFFAVLHNSKGKKMKTCALVGPELSDEAAKHCDFVINAHEFERYNADKKLQKKLVEQYDYFIAQANIMAKVAQVFGRVFGPRGKMPNPKSGCVVPPKTAFAPLIDKLNKTIRMQAKTSPIIMVPVGNEVMDDNLIADNVVDAYNQLIHHLPGEKNNIKSIYLKLTMSKPEKIM